MDCDPGEIFFVVINGKIECMTYDSMDEIIRKSNYKGKIIPNLYDFVQITQHFAPQLTNKQREIFRVLYIAIIKNDYERVLNILRETQIDVNEIYDHEEKGNLFELALFDQHFEIADLLLEYGARPNLDEIIKSHLHYSYCDPELENPVTEYLLKKGANPLQYYHHESTFDNVRRHCSDNENREYILNLLDEYARKKCTNLNTAILMEETSDKNIPIYYYINPQKVTYCFDVNDISYILENRKNPFTNSRISRRILNDMEVWLNSINIPQKRIEVQRPVEVLSNNIAQINPYVADTIPQIIQKIQEDDYLFLLAKQTVGLYDESKEEFINHLTELSKTYTNLYPIMGLFVDLSDMYRENLNSIDELRGFLQEINDDRDIAIGERLL